MVKNDTFVMLIFVTMESQSLQIKFDGGTHQIDANTLINTLIHYNAIISEINRVHGNGEKKINLVVNALKEGSFVIDVSLVESVIKSIFSSKSISYVAELVTILGAVFGAYQFLKGKPAKTEEQKESIKIADNIELNTTIVNIYNTQVVREAISKSFETVTKDANVEGVSILRQDDKIFSAQRSEFEELIYNDFAKEDEIPEEIQEIDDDAVLVIKSLSFQSGASWSFYYRGFPISIHMKNSELLKSIDKGARFGKGDALKVKLCITKRYVKEYKAYENKSFRIVEFYEHIQCATDQSLF